MPPNPQVHVALKLQDVDNYTMCNTTITRLSETTFSTSDVCALAGTYRVRLTEWVQRGILRPNGAEHGGNRGWRFCDVFVCALCEQLRRRGVGSRVILRAVADKIYTTKITEDVSILTIGLHKTGHIKVAILDRQEASRVVYSGEPVVTVDLFKGAAQLTEDVLQQIEEHQKVNN